MRKEPSQSDGQLLAGRVVSGPASARFTIDGRDYINFAGCGYLALGRLPELREAALRVIRDGAAFSRQVSVTYGAIDPVIRDIETVAAAYAGTETAVYFASGYLNGAAALNSVDTRQSVLFADELTHYSLLDAARLTGRPIISFAHCDPDALSAAIKKDLPPRMRPLVLSDGVFATAGRLAPLDKYAAIIGSYDGRLVVDEAHSFGVIGAKGRGAADFLGVESIATTAATLSKAFCGHGAIIGCDEPAARKVRSSPSLRGANSGSPISASIGAAAFRHVMARPGLRSHLAGLTAYLRSKLRSIGVEVGDSPAPIVAFRVGDRASMQSVQRRLFDRGIHVLLSNYIGSGPEGIIRCSVFADHSEADLDALVAGLG